MKLKLLVEQANVKQLLTKLLDDNLVQLNSLYKDNGYTLRIVGGAVRDILRSMEPKDIDLASDATPEESMSMLKSKGIRIIETGLKHGTITAHMDGEDYEITTLRIDVETDGRHAEVEYTKDWEQDAARRDLTFNAMSMDFDGNLYDYHGGNDDLQAGVAKFVGDAATRVQEDYLRILRYFRFQGRLATPKFDEATLDTIKNNASGLVKISGERIWSEMGKILAGNHLSDTMDAMKRTDVLNYIGFGGDVDIKELARVKSNTDDPKLLLASLLPSVERLDVVREKWKFSNPEYNVMKFVIENRNKDITLDQMKYRYVVDLKQNEDKNQFVQLFLYKGDKQSAKELTSWEPPQFPVNGNDVMKSKGIPPGKEVREVLYHLKKYWADSDYTLTKDEMLNSITESWGVIGIEGLN
jgi:tRNA nucleotidyltransferase (CCA-adding enzyme)